MVFDAITVTPLRNLGSVGAEGADVDARIQTENRGHITPSTKAEITGLARKTADTLHPRIAVLNVY
jgi:hypothetical protein